ncbi:hypothetical protein D9M68_582900 [compost metagenome]
MHDELGGDAVLCQHPANDVLGVKPRFPRGGGCAGLNNHHLCPDFRRLFARGYHMIQKPVAQAVDVVLSFKHSLRVGYVQACQSYGRGYHLIEKLAVLGQCSTGCM